MKKSCSKMKEVKSHLAGDAKTWDKLSVHAKDEAKHDKDLKKKLSSKKSQRGK
jgi:hypothetical protein